MDVTSHNSHFAANRGDAARADAAKSQFYRSFWRSTTISCDGQHLHSCIVASIWPFLNISTNVGSTWKMFGSDCKLFTAYWSTRFDMYSTWKQFCFGSFFAECEWLHWKTTPNSHITQGIDWVGKNWRVRSAFGSCNVEKVHGVVARSTFGSQKC